MGISFAEFYRRTILETEVEAVLPDLFHRHDLPVGQPECGLVAREAHLVSTVKLQALVPKQLDLTLCRRDSGRFPFDDVFQMDGG